MIILLISLLIHLSCATTENYEKMLDSWLGVPTKELVYHWGDPSDVYLNQEGTTIYVYSGHTVVDDYKKYAPKHYYCTTEFETNYRGIITKWKYKGNKCVSDWKYRPL